MEILYCAMQRRMYRQEGGANDFDADFPPEGTALLRTRDRAEALTVKEFYWLAAERVAHYCDKYHTSSGERERLDTLLENYQKCNGLSPWTMPLQKDWLTIPG